MTATTYTADELDRFREVQQLAYRSAVDVAQSLQPGDTEKEAARRLGTLLQERGVESFFHQPYAWFGDRTAFKGLRTPLDFFPSQRELQEDMPAILDVAPIVDGYAADIGYAFAYGHNPVLARALDDLQQFRELVLALVRRGDTLGEVYRAVDELLGDLGYRNCHRKYPFGVLAHRVYRQPRSTLANRPILGFSASTAAGLLGQFVANRVPSRLARRLPWVGRQGSPFCNVGPGSDAPAEPGLWAFEPHIAKEGVGAKWEELLLIEADGSASWLDDDLPHVRRWTEAKAS